MGLTLRPERAWLIALPGPPFERIVHHNVLPCHRGWDRR